MKEQILIIGIAGPSASGKSLLANTIVHELGSEQVAVIPEDAYYKDFSHLTLEEKREINWDHPNSFDHHLLCDHLVALRQGKCVDIHVYDHATYRRTDETIRIGQHRVVVLEGVLLFTDTALRECMDIQIFMDTPLDVCLTRRLKRDLIERERSVDSVLNQYEKTVRPMYFQFIEPSKRYADIIVPRGGENRIAIDMIKAKMREMLV